MDAQSRGGAGREEAAGQPCSGRAEGRTGPGGKSRLAGCSGDGSSGAIPKELLSFFLFEVARQ